MPEKLYFTETGSGRTTLVFLHYFGGSSRTWKEVTELLHHSFRCIAIDLPGFGNSAPLPAPAIENTVLKLEALIEKLALNNYVLVGHSMGGKIALALAANQPKGLKNLILVAPSPPTPEPMDKAKKEELLKAFGNKETLKKIAKGLVAKSLTEIQLKYIIEDNLRIHHTAWQGWLDTGSVEDISSQVKNIVVPVTIISGSIDKTFSTTFLKTEFTKWFSNPIFIELPDAGHLLPVEVPENLADVIRNEVNQYTNRIVV